MEVLRLHLAYVFGKLGVEQNDFASVAPLRNGLTDALEEPWPRGLGQCLPIDLLSNRRAQRLNASILSGTCGVEAGNSDSPAAVW